MLAFSISSFAVCDCFEILSHRKEFRKSKAVFVGEVVKIENPNAEAREDLPDELKNELGELITLKVIRSWKGSKTKQVIWTHATYELCSKWKFKVGEKYLIYARKVKGVLLGAEFCSRTRPLETADQEQIKEFAELSSF
jgi:hypothetical protein